MSVRIREVVPHVVLAVCLALAFAAAVKAGNAKSAASESGAARVPTRLSTLLVFGDPAFRTATAVVGEITAAVRAR